MNSEFSNPDPRSRTLNLVAATIFIGLVWVVAILGFAVWALVRWRFDPWLGVGFATSVFAPAGLLWYIRLFSNWEYERSSWRLSPQGFEVRKGVFWRHQIVVPAARVQHLDVSQGPLQRRFGLATLTVFTAGTQNSSVAFEGLAHDVAVELKDRLVALREATDVV